jgi:hypothetical protein
MQPGMSAVSLDACGHWCCREPLWFTCGTTTIELYNQSKEQGLHVVHNHLKKPPSPSCAVELEPFLQSNCTVGYTAIHANLKDACTKHCVSHLTAHSMPVIQGLTRQHSWQP